MTKSVCALEGCKKKISLVENIISMCKCGKKHCTTHRLSESHQCNYDYRSDINVEETIKNMKCVSPKLKTKI